MAASEHLSGEQFKSVFLPEQKYREVPRHNETGEPPKEVYRWAHQKAVEGYEHEGVPSGTHFSLDEPDDRYKASDHILISAPYSDENFRSSHNMQGEHYVATTGQLPAEKVKRVK